MDVAELGFKISFGDATNAAKALNALVAAAEKVEAIGGSVSVSARRASSSLSEEAMAANDATGSMRRLESQSQRTVVSQQAVARSAAQTQNNVRNMSYQFIDVAQGLAMGQPVYMIAAQQLGQIGQIAAFSGMSVKQWAVEFGVLIGVLKKVPAANAEVAASNIAVAESAAVASAANAAMATTAGEAAAAESVALAPLAPVLLAVAAAAAIAGAGFLGVKSAANDAAQDDGFIKSLGLTDEQLKKLGKTNVTIGDTFAGLGDMVGALWGVIDKGGTVTKTVGGAFSWLGDKIGTVVDWAIKEFQYFVANGVGSARSFLATWKEIPGAVGDIVISVSNATIKGVEAMINAVIGGINNLTHMAHLDGMFSLSNVSLGQLKNPFSGQAEKWGQDSAKEYATGFNQAMAILASAPGFAEARRNARLKAAAEALKADGSGSGSKSGNIPINPLYQVSDAWKSEGKIIPLSQAYQLGHMQNDSVKALADPQPLYDAWSKAPEILRPVETAFKGLGYAISQAMGQAIANSLDLGSTVSQVFRQMEAEYIANKIGSIFSSIASAFGSSGNGNWFANEFASFFSGKPSANDLPKANALGGVYSSPSLSTYSGHVYNTPQMFKFAKGAGVFAEAGPEAIMPLTRGSNGKLGVMAHGGVGAVYAPLIQFPLDGIVEPFRTAFSQMNDKLKAQQQETLNKARKQAPGWSSYRSAYGSA